MKGVYYFLSALLISLHLTSIKHGIMILIKKSKIKYKITPNLDGHDIYKWLEKVKWTSLAASSNLPKSTIICTLCHFFMLDIFALYTFIIIKEMVSMDHVVLHSLSLSCLET